MQFNDKTRGDARQGSFPPKAAVTGFDPLLSLDQLGRFPASNAASPRCKTGH